MATRREDGAASGRDGSGASATRRRLLDGLFAAGREVSAAAVMFHTALAARQGLSATEEKALNLLDRLEAKGFARRTRNPHDGRSVLIEAAPDRLAQLGPLFADWVRELEDLTAKYTDAE